MGFNSVIFICNDAMDQIDKDPKGWWKKTKKELDHQTENDGTYGFGNHLNGFQVVSNEHADDILLIAVGGNYATVIDKEYGGWKIGHHTIDGQIKLLTNTLKRLKKEKKKQNEQTQDKA